MDAYNSDEYDSYDFPASLGGPWFDEGGTSLAAPMFAGLVADADQSRVQAGLKPIGSVAALDLLYDVARDGNYSAGFNDITTGSSSISSTRKRAMIWQLASERRKPWRSSTR